ncbi:hypothetical protein YC2023_020825 [Brassica napus]
MGLVAIGRGCENVTVKGLRTMEVEKILPSAPPPDPKRQLRVRRTRFIFLYGPTYFSNNSKNHSSDDMWLQKEVKFLLLFTAVRDGTGRDGSSLFEALLRHSFDEIAVSVTILPDFAHLLQNVYRLMAEELKEARS